MKLKFSVLVSPDFIAAFQKLSRQPLGMPDSYRVAKCARAVNRANEDFRAAQLAFFRAHGVEKDGQITLDRDDQELMARYHAELESILAIDVDFPIPAPIRLPAACDLTALELLPIIDLVEVEEVPARPKREE